MTERPRRRSTADLTTREAAAWFSRLRADDVSEQDRARFEHWLEADPRHRTAYAAFERFWSKTGNYASDRGVAEAAHAAANAAKLVEAQAAARAAKARARIASQNRRRYFATAASVCVMALAVAFMALWPRTNQAYQTGIGEQRSVMLDDGSRITLNTNSRVRVSYSEHKRTVQLARGQAYFRVAKEQRPFEVKTRDGVVRAVGTAFDVYQSHDGMIVTVAEGTVMVTDPADGTGNSPQGTVEHAAKMLHAGERVALASGAQLQLARVETAPVERSVAWLGGKLIFDAEPLAQAAAEINRYSARQVLLGDARLNTLQMSGVFRVGETDDFVRSVSEYFSLRVEADSRGNYVLYARK